MSRLFILCVVLWIAVNRTLASMWVDPDWAKMLKESELIVLVEVVEGGTYVAKVRPISAFKGKIGSEFYVTGFNNISWPADAISTESFHEKQRYYLFLRREKDAVQYLQFMAEAEQSEFASTLSFVVTAITGWRFGNDKYDAPLKAAEAGLLWSVWSPTAGDLPVAEEKVHYSLLRTSYSNHGPERDQAEFEDFLKAAIAFQRDGRTDPASLDETLRSVRAEAAKPASHGDESSELSRRLMEYFLLGGRAYDPVFDKIARGDDADARFALARLLGAIHENKSDELLRAMLEDKNGLVQGEVVRQLAKGDAGGAGPVLLAYLAGAAGGGIGPQGIMDPLRNRIDDGKAEIIRALGELKYQPAAPALIELLENANNSYHLHLLLEALEKMGNRDYFAALAKPLRNPKVMRDASGWIGDHRLTELKPVLEDLLEHPPDGGRGGAQWAVIEALGKVGDERSGAKLTAQLEKLSARNRPKFFDSGVTAAIIGALADLHYEPAQAAVEKTFFYWLGVDSTFAAHPELLDMKRRLESEIQREAAA